MKRKHAIYITPRPHGIASVRDKRIFHYLSYCNYVRNQLPLRTPVDGAPGLRHDEYTLQGDPSVPTQIGVARKLLSHTACITTSLVSPRPRCARLFVSFYPRFSLS